VKHSATCRESGAPDQHSQSWHLVPGHPRLGAVSGGRKTRGWPRDRPGHDDGERANAACKLNRYPRKRADDSPCHRRSRFPPFFNRCPWPRARPLSRRDVEHGTARWFQPSARRRHSHKQPDAPLRPPILRAWIGAQGRLAAKRLSDTYFPRHDDAAAPSIGTAGPTLRQIISADPLRPKVKATAHIPFSVTERSQDVDDVNRLISRTLK